MIHHLSLGTNDPAKARTFYDPVMKALGLPFLSENEQFIGYGVGGFAFDLEKPSDGGRASPGNGVHIAFHARDRKVVDEFHRMALAHGGRDDGAPGLRPEYNAHYYAAFVRDPDGNKIEAVTYSPT
jgi:catechol 2,3-dioxygenase-like lactoylglutathione lyase family enzyme